MPIAFVCAGCQARFQVPESLAGRKVRCKNCQSIQEVPGAVPVESYGVVAEAPRPLAAAGAPARLPGIAGLDDRPDLERPVRRRKKKRRPQSTLPWRWVRVGALALAAVVGVGTLIYLVASAAGKWEEFESQEAHFRIAAPRAMKERTPPQLKRIDPSARLYMTEDTEDEALGVTFITIPAHRLASTPTVQILNDTCNGALANAPGSKQRYRQRLRRGPFEGMECVFDVYHRGEKKGVAVLHAYLVKGRGYSLLVGGKYIDPDSERVRRFCESFVVTDAPAFKGPIRRVGPLRGIKPASDPSPPANEIQYLTRLAPLTSAVFAPRHKAVLTLNEKGQLLVYTYPGFKLAGKYRLAAGAHRSALDEAAGRLYVATYQQPPGAIHPDDLKRQVGVGDIQAYDLKAVLADPRPDDASLTPAATIAVGGQITHLLPAPDGKRLYYLDVKEPAKPRLGVIDTAAGRESRTIPVAANTEVICLAPRGDVLYAAATLCGHKYAHQRGTRLEGLIQVIDPDSGKTRQSFKVDEDPFDLAVTPDQCLIVTGGSNQHRPVTVIDLKDEGGPLIEQVGSFFMNGYVRVSADGKRLYLADTGLSPATTQAWDLPALTRLEVRSCGAVRGTPRQPAGGDFYLSPDGKCLVCRTGALYWVTKAEPPPRLERQ